MRAYRTEEYKQNLVGNTFNCDDSSMIELNGMKVIEIIRELTEKDYDRELIDETDVNEDGKCRYEIACMYEVRLENREVVHVFEDEINPNYQGDYEG